MMSCIKVTLWQICVDLRMCTGKVIEKNSMGEEEGKFVYRINKQKLILWLWKIDQFLYNFPEKTMNVYNTNKHIDPHFLQLIR